MEDTVRNIVPGISTQKASLVSPSSPLGVQDAPAHEQVADGNQQEDRGEPVDERQEHRVTVSGRVSGPWGERPTPQTIGPRRW